MTPMFLLGAIVAGGAVFFLAYWAVSHIYFRRLNPVERAELIRRTSMDTDRRSIRQRGESYLRSFIAYKGSGNVLAYGWLVSFGASYALAIATGRGAVQGLAIAIPVSLLALAFISRRGARRQKQAFQRQLMTAMSLIASQLEAGGGLKRSFERVVEVVEDPLKSEFVGVLNQVETGSTIVEAVTQLSERYPSSAMKLFVAALEADAASPGGKLAPVLRSIAEGLEKKFELQAEAEAEIAQSKYQFYGIVAGLSVIAFLMYSMGGAETREAFTSPVGLLIIIPILANAVWGVIRIQKLFNTVSGGEQ